MPNLNQGFVGFLQDGKICDSYGTLVGYTVEEYQKAINTAKEYENILYEKGILTKPKTAEEINQELQQTLQQTQTMMLEMSKSLIALNQKVTDMENKDECEQKHGDGDSRKVSQSAETRQSK